MLDSNAIYRTFAFRIYPTRVQVGALELQLTEACRLYNAALQELKEADKRRRHVSYYDQSAQLPAIRAAGDLELSSASVAQEVLRRVHRTWRAFLARRERVNKPGKPRYKASQRYNSLTFRQYGESCRLREDGRCYLRGVGNIRVKWHRKIKGKIKAITVKRDNKRWNLYFVCECLVDPLPPSTRVVGVDLGLSTFATLSDGTVVSNPRHYQRAQATLRRAQRRMARRNKHSRRREAAVTAVRNEHRHIANQRRDFHHKVANSLVHDFGVIVVEQLCIEGLANSRLAKSVRDAGWASFVRILHAKAESAGRQFISVNPDGTTQQCSQCGAYVRKSLSQRWHLCLNCGLSLSRDENAARNVKSAGLNRLGSNRQAITVGMPIVA